MFLKRQTTVRAIPEQTYRIHLKHVYNDEQTGHEENVY